tara:strand:- start:408 stop:926 length:519 start_codon:yes stop_codon:yes gene_type:complete
METIVYSNFVNMNHKNGVFAILDIESCFACNQYMKELKRYNKDTWTIIAMSEENTKEFFEDTGLRPPLTRFYVDDKIEYEIGGILYDTQVADLYQLIASYSKGEIPGTKDFNIQNAKTRSLKVQYFQTDKFLNLELLGQNITARKDEFIVLYPDNRIDVLTEIEFDRRFEDE